MKKQFTFLCIIAFIVLMGPSVLVANAQDCNCSYTIKPTTELYDAKDVQPGQIICIQAADRGNAPLKISNVSGTSSNPIIIKNCGGRVTFTLSSTRAYGLAFSNSKHFRLTGSGDNGVFYGIKVSGGNVSVPIGDLSTDFEIDHLEIEKSGFAGLMAKTDPSCNDDSAHRGNFVMQNVTIRDNYIHDIYTNSSGTGGEALYIGNSFWLNGQKKTCDGQEVRLMPHEVKHLRIHNNFIKYTEGDGIQVGSAPEDVEIYDNFVEYYGTRLYRDHSSGIQIGSGTVGKVYNNHIKWGTGHGIKLNGLGNNLVYNNLIVGPGRGQNIYLANGIWTDDRGPVPGSKVELYNNTIIDPKDWGIDVWDEVTTNIARNNIIVQAAGQYYRTQYGATLEISNALNKTSSAEVGFVSDTEFRLSSTSPAVDAGYNLTSVGINADIEGVARPSGSGFDIGAYEYKSTGNSVVSLMLINADTDKDIRTLKDNDVIDYAAIGTRNISIRANTNPATVGSVVFSLDNGAYKRIESLAPYAMYGDQNGDYYAGTIAGGDHILVATPYTSAGAGGTAGNALTIRIKVVDSGAAARTAESGSNSMDHITAYPNPFSDKLAISLGEFKGDVAVRMYDMRGALIYHNSYSKIDDNATATLDLSEAKPEPGMYMIRLTGNGLNKTIKVIKE